MKMGRGDQLAPRWCECLFDELSAKLILYGRALGLSHGEAEDVLQDLFLGLLKRENEPQKPGPYCVRAYRNIALNYKRSLWRRLARELEARHWFEAVADPTENERAAMKCLTKLPADQREVIVLKIWHRMTFEEVALVVDRSPNTVAGRYRYGIEKLKRCLRESNHEGIESFGENLECLGPSAAV